MTRFLRFPDQLIARASLGYVEHPEAGPLAPAELTVDEIGHFYAGGEWDEDGDEVVAPAQLDGWHVNVLGDLPPEAEPFEVFPANPRRVFAGVDP